MDDDGFYTAGALSTAFIPIPGAAVAAGAVAVVKAATVTIKTSTAAVKSVTATVATIKTATTITKPATSQAIAAAKAVDNALPGLPASAPKPLNLGSTGRTIPANLTEQLAMTEVRSAPAGAQLQRVTMTDPRWPASGGWVKMQQIVNDVNIHYVRNTLTGAVDDFKFVLSP